MDAAQQPVNAWADAEQRYQAGQEVSGIVTRIAQFGVFVQVEPGVEGILYAFELGSGPAVLAGFTPGQEMTLYVKNIDVSRKRLELCLHNDPVPGPVDELTLPPLPFEGRQKRSGQFNAQSWPLLPSLPDLSADPQSADHPDCPACQRAVQAGWKFCVFCGGTLQRRCSTCGSLQPDLPDARYCYECGQPV
jgi:hypothetical protein